MGDSKLSKTGLNLAQIFIFFLSWTGIYGVLTEFLSLSSWLAGFIALILGYAFSRIVYEVLKARAEK